MKKQLVSIFLSFVFIIMLTPSAYAEDVITLNIQSSREVIYFDNGSYITITLIIQDTSPWALTSSRSTSFTRTGRKLVTSSDKDGNLEWEYTLYGEFSVVEGVSATCTSATYSQTIYQDNWSFSNGDATKSGNTAYGTGTFKRKVLFITVDTMNIDINLSCDIYGNLS